MCQYLSFYIAIFTWHMVKTIKKSDLKKNMNFSPRYMICKHLFTTLVLEKHPIITTVQIEIPLKLWYKNVTKNLSKLQDYVIIKGR